MNPATEVESVIVKVKQMKQAAQELDLVKGNKFGYCRTICGVPGSAGKAWLTTGQPPPGANLAPVAVLGAFGTGIWGTRNNYSEILGDSPSWIWAGGSNHNPNSGVARGPFLLVKKFNSATATTATLRFTADNEANVWLNGVHLGAVHHWSRLNRAYDAKVQAGENVLTAVVYNVENFGAGGFVATLKTDSGSLLAKTDGSWTYLVE